jgi:hypothetical protein
MASEQTIQKSVQALFTQLRADGLPIWWLKVSGNPFQRRGVPDLIINLGGRFYAIELKTETGVLSKSQTFEINAITLAHGIVAVCTTKAQVADFLMAVSATRNGGGYLARWPRALDRLLSVTKGLDAHIDP